MVHPYLSIISDSLRRSSIPCISVIFMVVGSTDAKYMSSAPLTSGDITLSAPERYNLRTFSLLLALVTIHMSSCISLAVKVMNRLSTSLPVVIITPRALFIPASIMMLSSVASPWIVRTLESSHISLSITSLFFSIITTCIFLSLSSL